MIGLAPQFTLSIECHPGGGRMMVQWEYKVVVHKLLTRVPDNTFTSDLERASLLNTYGAQGWELVAVMNQSYRRESDPTALYGYTIASYFLKRPAERPGAQARYQSHVDVREDRVSV